MSEGVYDKNKLEDTNLPTRFPTFDLKVSRESLSSQTENVVPILLVHRMGS